jgi:methionyl-tRNA formyltransferase
MNERIVFLGTPKLAADCLKGLVEGGLNIVGVVTKEDKIRGRHNTIEESDVAIMAKSLGIPVFKPHRLNLDHDFLYQLKPDLLLTFAYGQLINDEILTLGKYKPLNLHGSILPKYRGAAPMQYALKNGDTETGVSLMEMVHEMDAGDIYALKTFPLTTEDNYTTLCDKISKCGTQLALEALPKFFRGELTPIRQNPEEVVLTRKISKEEEHLNIHSKVDEFINQVRMLSLTPGGYLLKGEETIKIYHVTKINDRTEAEEGTILLAHKKQIVLQLKDGQVNIDLLQRPGKKMMSASDFNNGVKDFQGVILR